MLIVAAHSASEHFFRFRFYDGRQHRKNAKPSVNLHGTHDKIQWINKIIN